MARTSLTGFIEDQLRSLGRIEARPMFGGFGLYLGAVFFGIVFKDRLYFKTDETTRQPYQQAGMKPFAPNPRQTLMSYFEVPADVLESSDELVDWAKRAVECQLNALRRSRPPA